MHCNVRNTKRLVGGNFSVMKYRFDEAVEVPPLDDLSVRTKLKMFEIGLFLSVYYCIQRCLVSLKRWCYSVGAKRTVATNIPSICIYMEIDFFGV